MQDATAADEARLPRRSANLSAVGKPPRSPQLRPYQIEAQKAIVEHRRRGIRTQLVSLATGLGKCVDPQTWVWSNGLRRFGEAWGNTRIAGPRRTDTVVGWYDDGVNPGKRITTEAGLTVDGTLAHRIWIRRNDGFEGWCRLADVQVGDYVAVARGRADFGCIELPEFEAYRLGRSSAAADANSDTRRLPHRREALERQSGGTVTLAPLGASAVPSAVLHGTRATVRTFLRGYFEAGRGVDPIASRRTSSRTLAEQIQQLLLGLGVFCGIRADALLDEPSYLIEIYDNDAFACDVLGAPVGRSAGRVADDPLALARVAPNDIVPGVAALLARASSGADWPAATDVDAADRPNPTFAFVRRWLAEAPDCDETRELRRIVDEHRAWTPIVAVADSAIGRIDCQVEDSHAFVGNGIVNHNTVIIATLPKLLGLREGDVTLVVAHRDELIEQIVDKMHVENPAAKIGVEKAERRADDDSDIVVATVQTLGDKRLAEFSARFGRRIGLFVIDEAHHAAAPSYRAIVDRIQALRSDAMIMGFTATPNRGDGVRLVDVFEKIVYEMDTRKAIDAGYLVPVKSFAVATTTNLDSVASRGGDFVIGALAAAVNTVDRNARIVASYKQHTPG